MVDRHPASKAQVNLPSYVFCSPEQAQHHAKRTREGLYALHEGEIFWRDRQPYLDEHGYALRPRYHPEWSPSWQGTNIDPMFCEDSISLIVHVVIDATRKADGKLVSIKTVKRDGDEVRIASYLSRPEVSSHPLNHCVRMLDIFTDPFDQDAAFMVMPYLRPFDNPELGAIGEVTEFVRETLEGLTFIHSQSVAHRDCAAANIMMDAAPLYPQGHHPVRRLASSDSIYLLSPLSRTDHPVRYYFIDFGISSMFEEGQSPYVVGRKGRDKELPELSDDVPYDAYKVDIFILGNLYKKDFLQKYHGLEFLEPLIKAMTARDPAHRPEAEVALKIYYDIRRRLNPPLLRWRLRPRDESAPERIIYDSVAVAREGIYRLKHIVG
ncbi:kinase-like domain-containing protein [Sparassis latifolia]